MIEIAGATVDELVFELLTIVVVLPDVSILVRHRHHRRKDTLTSIELVGSTSDLQSPPRQNAVRN
jgi:hypothetical protein